jgi:hypothetical protein
MGLHKPIAIDLYQVCKIGRGGAVRERERGKIANFMKRDEGEAYQQVHDFIPVSPTNSKCRAGLKFYVPIC